VFVSDVVATGIRVFNSFTILQIIRLLKQTTEKTASTCVSCLPYVTAWTSITQIACGTGDCPPRHRNFQIHVYLLSTSLNHFVPLLPSRIVQQQVTIVLIIFPPRKIWLRPWFIGCYIHYRGNKINIQVSNYLCSFKGTFFKLLFI